jgi:hypothetical protein
MENALSYITALPSDEKELKKFIQKVKAEIPHQGYPVYIQNQLIFGKRLFDELLADKELKEYFDITVRLQK